MGFPQDFVFGLELLNWVINFKFDLNFGIKILYQMSGLEKTKAYYKEQALKDLSKLGEWAT